VYRSENKSVYAFRPLSLFDFLKLLRLYFQTSDSDKLSKKEYSQRLAKFLCEYGSQTLPYLKNAIDFIRMERPDVFNGQDNDIFFFVGWGLIVLSGKRVRVNDVFGGILSSMSLESHLK